MTIGILPGKDKRDANPYIDIALPTSIGWARNTIVACSADIIVALPGSFGTNSEICYGLVYGWLVMTWATGTGRDDQGPGILLRQKKKLKK